MIFKTAQPEDYIRVRDFYYSLIDAMENARYKPGWKRDVYPTSEFLKNSVENGELYIGEIDGVTASCMVLNHECNDGYKSVKWSVDAEKSELLVIHALGVHPDYSGKGIAKQMVQNALETARKNKIKTIRLDVLDGNLPAEKVYTKMGFVYRDTVTMFYEDTGFTSYKLFEYIV